MTAHILSLALLHFLWQGTVAATLLSIALFLMRKRSANARYVLSCAALAAMVLAPAVTAWALRQDPIAVSGTAVGSSGQVAASAGLARSVDWMTELVGDHDVDGLEVADHEAGGGPEL